ncbi:MAG: helix-turn-helix domain-containing protein [Rhodobacteraceae bacterium]|nr:helix-turn-helix domain-containing protein [Paracoccaceae bacterium]
MPRSESLRPDQAAPAYLTPRELAEHWRVSVRSLERWRAEGYGPRWVWIGGSVRYAAEDVRAWEQARRGDR